MPIIWRHLLKHFFKVFLLTTTSFVLILLVTRLREIARIVAISHNSYAVVVFILNILPFILPIAIPIASLIATIVLYSRLSSTSELTALRSSGFSLTQLIFPVLAAAFLLSIINFIIVSELSTRSHLNSKKLINTLITKNPFYMLEHKNNLRIRDFYFDMQTQKRGQSASNLMIVAPSNDNQNLNLIYAHDVLSQDKNLIAPSLSIISHLPLNRSKSAPFVIENQKNFSCLIQDFTQVMKSSHFRLQVDHFTMPYLLASKKETKNKLKKFQLLGEKERITHYKKIKSKHYSEIFRRTSIGLSVFSFTLLGLSSAIQIGRSKKRGKFITLSLLTTLGLVCFFAGKAFSTRPTTAALIYFLPHLLIFSASTVALVKVSRGIE